MSATDKKTDLTALEPQPTRTGARISRSPERIDVGAHIKHAGVRLVATGASGQTLAQPVAALVQVLGASLPAAGIAVLGTYLDLNGYVLLTLAVVLFFIVFMLLQRRGQPTSPRADRQPIDDPLSDGESPAASNIDAQPPADPPE